MRIRAAIVLAAILLAGGAAYFLVPRGGEPGLAERFERTPSEAAALRRAWSRYLQSGRHEADDLVRVPIPRPGLIAPESSHSRCPCEVCRHSLVVRRALLLIEVTGKDGRRGLFQSMAAFADAWGRFGSQIAGVAGTWNVCYGYGDAHDDRLATPHDCGDEYASHADEEWRMEWVDRTQTFEWTLQDRRVEMSACRCGAAP